MIELRESLAIWPLNSEGESIPQAHPRVLSLLETLYPGKWGQDILDRLISEGWVRCTIYGSYELSAEGVTVRKTLPDVEQLLPPEVSKPMLKGVAPWATFRKLVAYYADCVKHQERSQQYLFGDDYKRKYMLPVLPYGWLKELGEENEEIAIIKESSDLVAINTILARRSYEEEVYIGYPLEAFHHNGKTHYVPIMLIPVDVRTDAVKLHLNMRLDEADINHAWLEYHVNKENHQVLLNLLTSTHADDKYCGLVDVCRALPYLERYARGCSPGMFNPNKLQWVLPQLSTKGGTSCNCAALFVGTELKYSRTLLRELKQIAQEKDDVLDRTALAYVFREPVLECPNQERNYAYSFIPCNDEQQLAVTQSLCQPITLVTGPPGTGKSQVAVNIIANQMVRNKSVLFTSKNHKAVHAISERCTSILSDYGVDLVHFCSTPDGQLSDEWFKKDIRLLLGKLLSIRGPSAQWEYEDVNEVDRKWQSVCSNLGEREALETELSQTQSRVEELDEQLRRHLGVKDRAENVTYPERSLLKKLAARLCDKSSEKGMLGWIKRLLWRLVYSKRNEVARGELKKWMPTKVAPALPSSYIKQEVESFLKKLSEYKKLCSDKREIQRRCERLMPLETARECLQADIDALPPKLVPALLHVLKVAAKDINEDVNKVKQLESFQASYAKTGHWLKVGTLTEDALQNEVLLFKRFLQIAPAWATTMLSLTRSAPCLPAVYDCVVIDEASQCDVPPLIPALYRAKHAVLVGDPQQFPPVVTMRTQRNEYLLNQHHLSDSKYSLYDYSTASAYSVCGAQRVMLTNHYRCHPDIVDFFNEAFYNNRLNVCTVMDKLKSPSAYGLKSAVEWVDVPNSVDQEIEAVVNHVATLAKNGYTGSVGVITPLRKYALQLDEKLNKYRHAFNGELIVNTVNAFQGGEKDVVIFMLSYTADLAQTQKWYLTAESNRYIYNVAVSRARACLILVGDRTRCAESQYALLRKLAATPRMMNTLSDVTRFDSVWEERLYGALVESGIQPQTQYHLVGRRLDMAIITDSVKLDIEVDGVRWHTSVYGGRKVDDLWRDIQVTSAGWKVLRFWVYELEKDMEACVQAVKAALSQA